MCITRDQFILDAKYLSEKTKTLEAHQRWLLTGTGSDQYLCKNNLVRLFPVPEMRTSENSQEFLFEELEEEDCCTFQGGGTARDAAFFFDYHIAYCTTFCVPLMLFNVYDEDRRLLSLEEVELSRRPSNSSGFFFTSQKHSELSRSPTAYLNHPRVPPSDRNSFFPNRPV
jgi:hypothetical protein